MINDQALYHTHGLSNYVFKYTGKFYEGNFVVSYQYIHTGEWFIGKNHLCGTKFVV